MKIKKIIKKNLLGFVIGGILFGTITTVIATSIAASTLAYTTTENNNVATVNDAVVDLYNRVYGYPIACYNGTCGKLSYKYYQSWSDGNEFLTFQSNELPTPSYETLQEMINRPGSSQSYFNSNPYYIRSVLIDGNVVGHQTCFWNNNKEFCLGLGYWAGTLNTSSSDAGNQTKIKLQRDMQKELGVASISCTSDSSQTQCYIGDSSCIARYNGSVCCGGEEVYCEIFSDGSFYCGF